MSHLRYLLNSYVSLCPVISSAIPLNQNAVMQLIQGGISDAVVVPIRAKKFFHLPIIKFVVGLLTTNLQIIRPHHCQNSGDAEVGYENYGQRHHDR